MDRPKLCGGIDEISKTLFFEHKSIDFPKLLIYARRNGNNTVIKRLGYILETYNTLYWYYKVRPLKALIQKLSLVLDLLEPTNVDFNGLNIALAENIPLGDAFLIATAQAHKIPVIISNDQHIHKKATKYGLILENPITPEIRQQLSDAS